MPSKYKSKGNGSTVRPSLVNKTLHDHKWALCSICGFRSSFASNVGKMCSYCGVGYYSLSHEPIIY